MIESLEDMLVRHEGMVLHAYQDSESYWTIGVGRLIDKRKGGGITEEEARYLLKNDIQRVVQEAKNFPWYEGLNNPRKQAVLNLLFNMGLPTFGTFRKTIAAMEIGDYETAAKELLDSRYARQTGKRAIEISDIIRTGELT